MKHPIQHPTVCFLVLALSLLIAAPASAASTLWEFDAGGKIFGKPTLVGDTLYLAADRTVFALDLEGNELWRHDVAGDVAARVGVDDGTIYVHSSAGLHALDQRGEPLWIYETEDLGPLVDGRTWGWGAKVLADPWGWYRSSPTTAGDAVIFGNSDGVHAVGKASGERLWAVPVGPVTADPAVYGDLVVVACWNHSVYGLDLETGKVRWRFRASLLPTKGVDWIGYQGFHVTPTVADDRIFVGNRNTYFYSLNAKDGTVAWSSKVGASWIGSPAFTTEEHVYYGLSDGHAVLGFRRDSGKQTLFFDTGATIFAQPELHDGNLLVGTLTGHLFLIDTTSRQGRLFHHFGPEEPKYAEYFDPEIVPEGLTAYEATEWSIERWLTESNGILNLTVADGVAYVGTASGVLYALGLTTPD